ncbi:MAG: type II secretion system F family protein [bacterium]
MPYYIYKAREFNGRTISGTMEAENEDEIIERLHRRNAVPLSVTLSDENIKKSPLRENLLISLKRFSAHVRLQDLLLFTNQLSAMFGAGIPISKSIQSIANDTKKKSFQEIITEVYRSIEAGDDLSQAMARYPSVFNELYVSLVQSGEVSGTLGIILPQLASYLEKTIEIRGRVKAAITYPIAIISFAILVISFLIVSIVPKFGVIYQRLKAPLPLPTQILLKGSLFLKQNFLILIFSFLLLLILFYSSLHTKRIGFLWDKAKLRLPIFGPLIIKSTLAKFTKTLSVLLHSGMPIIQSIQIVSNSVGNRYLKEVLDKCSVDIQKGASVSQAFSESRAFPNLLIQMMSSGEESGTLHIMLEKTSDFYHQQVSSTVASLTSIIEPILIIIIGGVVAFIALSIFLPIFKMGGAL